MRGDASTQREPQQNRAVEDEFEDSEPLLRHRVVRGLGMIPRRDDRGELGRDGVAVISYVLDLPRRQPDLDGQMQGEGGQEYDGEDMHM